MMDWLHILHGTHDEPDTDLNKKRRRYNYFKWMTYGFIAICALAGIGLFTFQQVQINNRNQCTTNWANGFASRYDRVLKASNDRNDAIDQIVRGLVIKDPHERDGILAHAIEDYITFSNNYKNVQKANPLPPAPKFNC